MDDYIDVLLESLADQRLSFLGHEYFTRLKQEAQTADALCDTLSPEQRKLFLAYEAARNACASASVFAGQMAPINRDFFSTKESVASPAIVKYPSIDVHAPLPSK